MTRHWKILGMSLLALIGVFAVNAAAAQAKWLLLVELKPTEVSSIESLSLKGSAEEGYFLSQNGNEIHCEGATSTGTASLSEEDKKLSGSLVVTFTGCTDEQFPETCTVHSSGQADGTIVASGEGVAGMDGEEVFVKAMSSAFTTIEYLGEECPLNESNEVVSGEIKNSVLKPLELQKVHKFRTLGEGLKLGESSAELHMLDPETKVPLASILGSTEEQEGRPFAIHLCNLPGVPAC